MFVPKLMELVRVGGMGMEEVRAQVQQCGEKGFRLGSAKAMAELWQNYGETMARGDFQHT